MNAISALNMAAAGVQYAEKYGFRILPVKARSKEPALANWPETATNDPDEVKRMLANHTGNIGVACGAGSNLVVIDVDPPNGESTLATLEAELGAPPETLTQRTGGGGRQLFFRYPQGVTIKNSTGANGKGLGVNVDVRGEGGQCVLPPSIHPNGAKYSWLTKGIPPADLPPAWVERLKDKHQDRPPSAAQQSYSYHGGQLHPYARAAVDDELAKVSSAVPTTRNHILNTAAYALGRWVAGGELPEADARDMLFQAAEACGLVRDDGEQKVAKTISSGLTAGMREPRQAPVSSGDRKINLDPKNANIDGTDNASAFVEKPVPFDGISLPKIDTSLLPSVLREHVVEVAASIQVPAELVLANAIAAASTCLQKRAQVRIHNDYVEPLNLYLLAALPPGERKSAAVEACKWPLQAWERERREELRDVIRRAESDRKSLEKIIESKRGELGKAKGTDERLLKMEEICELEAQLPDVPVYPRLFIDDATPESVAVRLTEQDERLAVMEAEGGLFEILAGLYSSGTPNIDLFLKAWTGEAVTVDRRRSESLLLHKPLLTICISPQPEVIAKLADKPGFRGRGFLARFLYFMPHSLVGFREIDTPPVPVSIKAAYAAKLRSFLAITPAVNDAGHSVPHNIPLSQGANAVRLAMAKHIEENMRDGCELDGIKDWASKLVGNTLRLAGVLHFYEHENGLAVPISQETMRTAVYIAGVLVDHAKVAFSLMGADEKAECAKKILAWITRPRSEPMKSFTGRDCHYALQGSFKRKAELDDGLAILEERFFIAKAEPEQRKVGRPSQTYRVNPELFGGVQ